MKSCPTCHSTHPADFTHCPRDGTPLAEAGVWEDGAVIREKYRILGKVGEGAMGVVYKALHVPFRELRALKVISPDYSRDNDFVRRFMQEAVITRKLLHPNAVRVEDIDKAEDGRPFIVMEYIEGRTLKEAIRQEAPMPAARVCAIAKQAAAALDAAHRLGMVHRDVKPANIVLVAPDSSSPRVDGGEAVKVLDFGIAKIKEGHLGGGRVHQGTLTATGTVIGTPAYMSPEQAMGERGDELDGRSDIYSLAVVIYQMLTGDLPFKADSEIQMLMAHVSSPPQPILTRRRDIPPLIANLVMRCLEKDRELRPPGGKALIEEIENWEEELVRQAAAKRKAAEEVRARERAEDERWACARMEAGRLAAEKAEAKSDLPAQPPGWGLTEPTKHTVLSARVPFSSHPAGPQLDEQADGTPSRMVPPPPEGGKSGEREGMRSQFDAALKPGNDAEAAKPHAIGDSFLGWAGRTKRAWLGVLGILILSLAAGLATYRLARKASLPKSAEIQSPRAPSQARSSVRTHPAVLLTGAITGRVRDSMGRPMARVETSIKDEDGKIAGRMRSDKRGRFRFSALSEGSYIVLALPPKGYASGPSKQVTLEAGKRTAISLQFGITDLLPPRRTTARTSQNVKPASQLPHETAAPVTQSNPAPPGSSQVAGSRTNEGPPRMMNPEGVVDFVTDPPTRSQVFVDGTLRGTGPNRVEVSLGVGSHALKIQPPPGWLPSEAEIKVTATLQQFTIHLVRANGGYARVQTVPSGASIFLDGALQKDTSPADIYVSPGHYAIIASKPGCAPARGEIDVKMGTMGTISLKLQCH